MRKRLDWADRIGRRVKLHDLHVLLTTVEAGSMAKAAERLAISQPVVSRSVANLEHALGVRLLDRSRTGVEPTAYGQVLLTYGLAAFDDLRQAVRSIETIADPTAGEVRVGCPEPISAGLMCAVIDRFSRKYQRVTITVVAADNMAPEYRPLRDRQVDFLLGRVALPFAEKDLDAETLYQDRQFVVAGSKSPWARRRNLRLAELLDEPWLWAPSMFNWRIGDAFQRAGLPAPKVCVQTYSIQQKLNLLSTNRFIGTLAGSVLRFNGGRLSLKVLPVDLAIEPWSVGVVTLKGRTLRPVVQSFLKCVRDTAQHLVQEA
jgi:DNA-binding transcriptional LysR family regulator